jgi:hypothetical protein
MVTIFHKYSLSRAISVIEFNMNPTRREVHGPAEAAGERVFSAARRMT